jgi:hypothetical protein
MAEGQKKKQRKRQVQRVERPAAMPERYHFFWQ